MKSFFTDSIRKYRNVLFVVLAVAVVGTYLLVGSRAGAPYASNTADSGSLGGGASTQACAGSTDGNCVVFGGATGSTAVSQGASRSLSQDFLGFNSDAGANVMSDPSFPAALNQLNPETLRGIIGGTPSDYFNWQTGQYFIASSNTNTLTFIRPGLPNPPFMLSDYVNALKTAHANGIFNINVMTYCPVDNANPASTSQAGASCTLAQACGPNPSQYASSCTSTDYTWGLNYQIAMLQAAQNMGVPIKYIELGNELYITSNADYVYYFPTPQAYVNKVNAWIPVLKQDFPGAKVAVIGYHQPANTQESAWNQAIIGGVHGEDAVVFHTYYGSQIPNGGSVANPQDLATMLSNAAQAIYSSVQNQDLKYLPAGVSAWITEWNLWSDNLQIEHGSWAQGLTEANYALDLARAPQIELTDNHDLISKQIYGALFANSQGYGTTAEAGKSIGTPSPLPTTQPFGMTAGGFALSALLRSLHGATGTATLNFSSLPNIAGTSVPGLAGQSFTVNGKTNLYFVNLTATDETVSLGSLSGNYSVLQYASSPANFVTGNSSIPANSFTASNTVNIPAYSVTSLVQ